VKRNRRETGSRETNRKKPKIIEGIRTKKTWGRSEEEKEK
jgi:hypothetical protein